MSTLDNEVVEFYRQLRSEMADICFDPDDGGLQLTSVGNLFLDRFEEAGFIPAGHVAYFTHQLSKGTAEVHGYALDDEEDVLALFYFIPFQSEDPPAVSRDETESGYRKMKAFVRTVASGELIGLIRDASARGTSIRFFVVTNGLVSDRAALADAEKASERETWDIMRLYRSIGTGAGHEAIDIDLVRDYGAPLPCLVTPVAEDGLQILLTCIPGATLATIYDQYRARLLERNVRSFLQFAGSVNKGIRETILTAPSRFLPYNNGISATASVVRLRHSGDGLALIEGMSDFQIVNGGQTTASISACARKDKADLSKVYVPMKLTIVPAEAVDALVPQISRYANTQNRVQEADFSANHPYHIELEKLSRQHWTTPSPSSPRGTRWFYERSRGQYAVEKLKTNSLPAQRKFRDENPPSQRFTKTDLAKYVMSWDQYPQRVSLGAQKNFMVFMSLVERDKRLLPDEAEFKRVVGLAILYRTAERAYGELGYTGYRANVVAYTVALLSFWRKRMLDWTAIWDAQVLSDDVVEMVKTIMIGVRKLIFDPAGTQRNISEWAKKDACWSAALEMPFEGNGFDEKPQQPVLVVSAEQQKIIDVIGGVPPAVWFDAAAWAKREDRLSPFQRSLAFNVGRRLAQHKPVTPKQAPCCLGLLNEATAAGFRHNDLTDTIMSKVRNLG
jgi:hypothetical protein